MLGRMDNLRILLANQLQSSGSTFSCVSFPSFFAFQEGMWDTQISALPSSPTVSGRLMRHLARGVEEGLTPGARLSDCHLNKHRLINSLWTKVSERSEGVCPGQCPLALLNPQNFANTIGKPSYDWPGDTTCMASERSTLIIRRARVHDRLGIYPPPLPRGRRPSHSSRQ